MALRMPNPREMYLLMDLTKLYADTIGPPTVEPFEQSDFAQFIEACLEHAGVDISATRAACVMVKMLASGAFDDYEYQFLDADLALGALASVARVSTTTIH